MASTSTSGTSEGEGAPRATSHQATDGGRLEPEDGVRAGIVVRPEPASPPSQLPDAPPHSSSTRLSATWTAVVAAAVVLIALVIFIGQNTQQSSVNFLGVHGKAPTSVVLLIAALAGAAIVIIVGIARILQLRRNAKQANRGTPSRSD
jgi:uncharacterized integral membrane protein